MENTKMALFISDHRKQKKMTQKDLAELLGVTDKAVSKWERGLSCPDISLLADLADALGCTVSELLNGEKEPSHMPEVDSMVTVTLEYADTASKGRSNFIRSLVGSTLTSLSLIGILVCAICDYAMNGGFTWSLYPISSILFAWLSLLPLLVLRKRGFLCSLASFSLLLIPYFLHMNYLLGNIPLFLPIALYCSLVGLCYLWIVYAIFYKSKSKLKALSLSCVAILPINWLINFILSRYISSPIFDVWDLVALLVISVMAAILWKMSNAGKQPA